MFNHASVLAWVHKQSESGTARGGRSTRACPRAQSENPHGAAALAAQAFYAPAYYRIMRDYMLARAPTLGASAHEGQSDVGLKPATDSSQRQPRTASFRLPHAFGPARGSACSWRGSGRRCDTPASSCCATRAATRTASCPRGSCPRKPTWRARGAPRALMGKATRMQARHLAPRQRQQRGASR